jgi:hypothetical protein
MTSIFDKKVRIYIQTGDKLLEVTGNVRNFTVDFPTIDVTEVVTNIGTSKDAELGVRLLSTPRREMPNDGHA